MIVPRFQRLRLWGASLALAAIAALGVSGVAMAQSGPGPTVTVVTSCTTVNQGSSCTVTFHFQNASGNPETGVLVAFSVTGPGTVNPASATTNASGNVSAVLTASATACGTVTLTATGAGNTGSGQTTLSVPCNSGGTLPNTSTAPPSAPVWPAPVAGIALLVLAGGALTLRRMRAAA
jgi:hypothetical protein